MFVVFILIEIFLAIIGIWRNGILFSVIGLVVLIFLAPLTINSLIVERVFTVNPISGEATEHIVFADTSLLVMIFFLIAILQFLVSIRGVRG